MADLTPRLAKENGWTVLAHCDRCRVMKGLNIEALFRASPDRDLGEALLRGKLKCSRPDCGAPCTALDVSRQALGGKTYAVMKLTPGLTVTREDGE